ncbi:RelA/SpoT [Amycolatopsis camponoti]|uniref:RelA/SpoT n=1 Tax=Amycolatopsis camponoti TaxID=2606593 RepID=A0A6I8M5W4_9PSEU|nr:hypothetical protein [Amycolatopsis camponoti]VVJ23023.1 RelA/SpoT [Amycolatopsis camponoti]
MNSKDSQKSRRREVGSQREKYEESVAGLADMGSLVANLISAALAASKIQFHTVSFRVKELDSAHEKIASRSSRYPDYSALTDLLGLRVITYFEDDVDKVSDVLRTEFDVDEENSVDKRANLDSDRFGYLSVHFILTLGEKREHLVEYSRFGGKKFEVQVRSVLQHAWAEIEHDLGYKIRGGIPQNLRRRFSRVAGLLESADGEFRSLRNDIGEYQEQVRNTINTSPQDLSINQDTLLELLKSNETIKDIEAAAVADNTEAGVAPLSMQYIAKRADNLADMGVTTVKDLLDYTTENFSHIMKFSQIWASDPDGHFADEPILETPVGVTFWMIYLYWLSQELISGRLASAGDYSPTGWNNADEILRATAMHILEDV